MNDRIIKDNYKITEEENRLKEEIGALPYNIFLDHSLIQMYDLIIPLNNCPAHWLAINKFTDLDAILLTALNCLSNGCIFDHKSYTINDKDGIKKYTKEAEYQSNHHNLKSAVVWYNSAFDYLLQIIYFGFEFYNDFYDSESYEKELKACLWQPNDKRTQNFYNRFHNLAKNNSNADKLLQKWITLRKSAPATRTRELANTIKHHGIFDLDETKREIYPYTIINPNTGTGISGQQLIARPSIGYMKLIEVLITIHKDIIEFEKYLLGELGFLDSIDIIDFSEPRPFIKKSFSART